MTDNGMPRVDVKRLRLFHVSEEGAIARFDPRPVTAEEVRVNGSVVWAIDEAHLANYLLPRDCPRVTYVCSTETSDADRDRFFGISGAQRIIAIEPGWLERAMATPIYQYELPISNFECIDRDAGHYVARDAVVPLGVSRIGAPLAEMLKFEVELRVIKDLRALHAAVSRSTLSFSTTRLRNAEPA
jgi:hypothetical protein